MQPNVPNALRQAWPGWVLLDSALQLSEQLRVDWVGRDREGLLLLVCRGLQQPGESAQLALKLALAARQLEAQLLRRYLARELRVVLLLAPEQRSVAELLAPLCQRPLLCMEWREWHSAGGSELALERIEVSEAPLCITRETALKALDRGLGERARRLAETLEAPALGARLVPGLDRWEFLTGGQLLCSLSLHPERLEARVGSGNRIWVLDSAEAEREFLDAALRERLRLPSAGAADSASISAEISAEKALDPREPVLTREELQAFRALDSD